MSQYQTIFGGSRVLRLTVFVVASSAFFLFLWLEYPPGVESLITVCVVEIALFLTALVTISPQQFHWAGRVLGGMIFLTYLLYFVLEVLEGNIGELMDKRSESNAVNAAMGLLKFGLPGLVYAVWPRRAKPVDPGFELGDSSEKRWKV